jgi:large subunit ribosomal protein L9
MKVILQQEVDKLGSPGDVVDVADGFARNFLIPRGLAATATKGGMRHATKLRARHQDRVQREIAETQAFAARLSATPVRLTARAGEDGRLFGSITAADVAAGLERAGTPVDRKRVRLDEPIRSVGAHEVLVHLHPEVNATVTVEVAAQT